MAKPRSAVAVAAALSSAASAGVRLACAVRVMDKVAESIVPPTRSLGQAAVAAHLRPRFAMPVTRRAALAGEETNAEMWEDMTAGGLIGDLEASSSMALSKFFDPQALNTKDVGEKGTPAFRRFLWDETIGWVSPVHDVPLHVNAAETAERWMITEIPKHTKAKFGVALGEPWNPLAPAMDSDGRFVEYPSPLKWNYGFLPQTWEDPKLLQVALDLAGDNDPVDVIELSSAPHKYGEATRIKILGALPLIDKGIADWKIIAVSMEDALSQKVDSVVDLEREAPGMVDEIKEWITANKEDVSFGLDGAVLGVDAALEIIDAAHVAWGSLHSGHADSSLWGHMSDAIESELPGHS